MTIELSDLQAHVFRLISQAGGWDIKNGSLTIHFNADGRPARAEVRQVTILTTLSTPMHVDRFDGMK